MKKIVLYSAVSIDAMIAPRDGSIGWLEDPRYRLPGEDFGYEAFLKTIDTTIMGYRTYRQMLSFGGSFPLTGKRNYVLTRSSRRQAHPEVSFLGRGVLRFIRTLRQSRGRNIWLVGGGQINTLLMNAGLIDRMVLTTIPAILGAGIPLFRETVRPRHFAMKKRTVYKNGFVQVVWDRK